MHTCSHFLHNVLFRHVCFKEPSIANRVRQQSHLQAHSSPFLSERRPRIIHYHDGWKRELGKAADTLMQDGLKRKLVMAGEAPILVLLVLVWLLVPQRRVYY